ncbi:aldehyde dehydrogenase [Basidiobolus meristosporus CBS 931.73]|uniref:Aldehyde dehydrogenase n=1 Tax=Basidiobolus meristosporus CBS 931.73 TaxID=1314790 RepID=A0A1Y1X5E0_9FUNG|nr:aldehyde dehydrogenase [Basidiobolus meristosporus CBS 931.73]|eukprot:ORX80534.1 aldehyde dehydrogenase [Basidiobolus meristosporus CBS 931.73]
MRTTGLKYTIKTTQLFIGNRFVDSLSSITPRLLLNPATGKPLAEVTEGSSEDVDRAVSSAQEALQGEWGEWNGRQRRDALNLLARTLSENVEELAYLESVNAGKPLAEAHWEINESIECFKHFSGYADKIRGSSYQVDNGLHSYTVREPAGVCGLITSFNYPLLLASWKLAPALATGNTVLLKPAPQTPLTALAVARLISDRDIFPKGVVNVVTGGASVGEAISKHALVDKCSFTGSTHVGKQILAHSAATNLKRVTLELGGKNPLLVAEDANIAQAVEEVFVAAFSNAGQNCCAGTRLYLSEKIHEEFLAKLQQKLSHVLATTDLEHPDCQYGPLIDERQYTKVKGFIDRARAKYNSLESNAPQATGGYFIEPTVFYGVDDDAEIAQEEIFGPVLTVLKPFKEFEEALERANRTQFGLAAGLWSKDPKKIAMFSRRIQAGINWVNCYNISNPYMPFGGFKLSGLGKDLGKEAIDEFTRVKSVTVAE